jgi:hypothetical protein
MSTSSGWSGVHRDSEKWSSRQLRGRARNLLNEASVSPYTSLRHVLVEIATVGQALSRELTSSALCSFACVQHYPRAALPRSK